MKLCKCCRAVSEADERFCARCGEASWLAWGGAQAEPALQLAEVEAAAASTAAGDTCAGLGNYDALDIVAELVGATGGTLDVYLQSSPDGGTTWFDYIHFPQLASAAAAVKYRVTVPTMGEAGITVIGKNTTPVLAANTVVGGLWSDRLRALYVAGASTSAGAVVTISILGYKRAK